MNLDIGIGREAGLSDDERLSLVGEAKALGYRRAWTNAIGMDGLDTCERWFDAHGIATGTSVIPTPGVDRAALASGARRFGERCDSRFILGVGAGPIANDRFRAKHNIPPDASPIRLMKQHLDELLPTAGVPVYLAAMGPLMLRLAGARADGAMPNWMDLSQISWARERIAEGARSVGRNPADIPIAQYIRVAVDDDEHVARTALALAAFSYVLARPGDSRIGPYRQQMTRMGLDAELIRLETRRASGTSDQELADACPDKVLDRLGAWGRPDRALDAVHRLSEGLDTTIVRVVCARPGIDAARAVLKACAPARWS